MAQRVIERPGVGEPPLRMGHEEWWSWSDSRTKSEWVDGEVIQFLPATVRECELRMLLAMLLSEFAQYLQLGQVYSGSLEMFLNDRGRVPDALFIKSGNLHRLTEKRLIGPADLAIEVVSEDSVKRDHKEKFTEYAAAGVAEYWMLESRPGEEGTAFYRLVDGVYQQFFPDADGRLWSTVVKGFWFRPAWLQQEPLPFALTCLFEIAPVILTSALDRQTDRQGRSG